MIQRVTWGMRSMTLLMKTRGAGSRSLYFPVLLNTAWWPLKRYNTYINLKQVVLLVSLVEDDLERLQYLENPLNTLQG